MEPDDLRRLMDDLVQQVVLTEEGRIEFEVPSQGNLLEAGHHPDGVSQLLSAPWLAEMRTDVLETADYCDPTDPPEKLLQYARDVVVEYIRKRFVLDT
jgi:hypothetical protein